MPRHRRAERRGRPAALAGRRLQRRSLPGFVYAAAVLVPDLHAPGAPLPTLLPAAWVAIAGALVASFLAARAGGHRPAPVHASRRARPSWSSRIAVSAAVLLVLRPWLLLTYRRLEHDHRRHQVPGRLDDRHRRPHRRWPARSAWDSSPPGRPSWCSAPLPATPPRRPCALDEPAAGVEADHLEFAGAPAIGACAS